MATPVTALARPLDLTLPSNRFALFAPGVVVAAATLVLVVAGADLGVAAGGGLRYGVATFLVWAIARELDPDRPRAARNAVFAYVPAMFLGPPELAAVVALLLAARVTLRSTGSWPTVVDLGVLAALAGVAATSAPGFATGLAVAWAVLDDGRLPDPAPQPRTWIATAAIAAAVLSTSVLTGAFLTGWRAPRLVEVVWVGVVVLAVVVRPRPADLSSPTDRGGALCITRLGRARLLTAAALALALLWAGADAIPALAPAAAALVGAGLVAPRRLGPRDLAAPLDDPTGAHP